MSPRYLIAMNKGLDTSLIFWIWLFRRVKLGLPLLWPYMYFYKYIELCNWAVWFVFTWKSFEGTSSLTNRIIPPPELFLSSQIGELKASITNCFEGKDGSTLVSEMSKISNLTWTICRSISNLFFKEFIAKWPMINLSALFNLTQSRTFGLLTTLSRLATIKLFSPSFFFIEHSELSYFMRNILMVVWATTKIVEGPYPKLIKCNPLLFIVSTNNSVVYNIYI